MKFPQFKTEDEALLALSFLTGIGPVLGKNLIQFSGCAKAVFELSDHELLKIDGIGPTHLQQIRKPPNVKQIDKEIAFCKDRSVQILGFYNEHYPLRLKQLVDSPLALFSAGNASLNHTKTLGIVGTRKPTKNGFNLTQQIVKDLKAYDIQIVSGLAYGIDGAAHQVAVECSISTVGVLAHGLDTIYPKIHTDLARKMVLNQGAVISEMPTGTNIHPDLFPRRNRIVAGMCDALLVVESQLTGGSMATAQIAHSYDREVLVIPGNPNDPMSKGCNAMVKRNVAHLIEDAADIIHLMKWNQQNSSALIQQLNVFPSLSSDEKTIMLQLTEKKLHIDELMLLCNIPLHRLTLSILELELKGLIQLLPGKFYQRVL